MGEVGTMVLSPINIRNECLKPAQQWVHPTGNEIREVLQLAGLSTRQAAIFLGLSTTTYGRTIRRWLIQESAIPYPAWALLCEKAGLGIIWKDEDSCKKTLDSLDILT